MRGSQILLAFEIISEPEDSCFIGLRRRQRRQIRLWVFVLVQVPLALDGITHSLNDLNGLASGFAMIMPGLPQ